MAVASIVPTIESYCAIDDKVVLCLSEPHQKSTVIGFLNDAHIDYEEVFYRSLERVNSLHMYDRFLETGWNAQLAMDTHQVLIPEIIRAVTLNWASCINEAMEIKNAKK